MVRNSLPRRAERRGRVILLERPDGNWSVCRYFDRKKYEYYYVLKKGNSRKGEVYEVGELTQFGGYVFRKFLEGAIRKSDLVKALKFLQWLGSAKDVEVDLTDVKSENWTSLV